MRKADVPQSYRDMTEAELNALLRKESWRHREAIKAEKGRRTDIRIAERFIAETGPNRIREAEEVIEQTKAEIVKMEKQIQKLTAPPKETVSK